MKKLLKKLAALPAKLVNGLLNALCAAFLEGYAYPEAA